LLTASLKSISLWRSMYKAYKYSNFSLKYLRERVFVSHNNYSAKIMWPDDD